MRSWGEQEGQQRRRRQGGDAGQDHAWGEEEQEEDTVRSMDQAERQGDDEAEPLSPVVPETHPDGPNNNVRSRERGITLLLTR